MKETEKRLKLLEEYLKDKEYKNEQEYDALVEEFMELHNSKPLVLEETSEMRSDDLFDKALNADSEMEMVKFIKASLKENPDNCDAKVFWAEYSCENGEQLEEELLRIIREEKSKLIKNGFFVEENIGDFYAIHKTRPYLRANLSLIEVYMSKGRMRIASEVIEEMMTLNNADDLGMRYRLISLYCFLEEYEKLEALNDKYNEESIMMLLPLSIYYYKTKNYHLLEKTLNTLNVLNDNLVGVILKSLTTNNIDNMDANYETYSLGSIEEAEIVTEGNLYLLAVTSGYMSYIANWKPDIKFKLS